MISLTPQQRIAAYEWAAERIDNGGAYICNRLKDYYNLNFSPDYLPSFLVQDVFIELAEFQPEHVNRTSSWFSSIEEITPGHNKEARLFILGSCILMAGGEL